MRIALLASHEKDEALLEFATFLKENEWELWASAGTARYLGDHGITATDVSSIVGEPILGHRVVTLSRELHAGLLATENDQKELDELGIKRIDLVYVTFYPLEEAVRNPLATPNDIIEKTDIGGPTLLRSAAKGRRIVISDASQIPQVESFIRDGELPEERERLVTHLVAAAERRVSEYTDASAKYWEART